MTKTRMITGTFRTDVKIGEVMVNAPVNDPEANQTFATVRIIREATFEEWIADNSTKFDPQWLRATVEKIALFRGEYPKYYEIEILD